MHRKEKQLPAQNLLDDIAELLGAEQVAYKEVMEQPKQWVIGSENVLKALLKQAPMLRGGA